MKYVDEYKNPAAAASIEREINRLAGELGGREISIMEVCGSHTMAIARYAIRDLLPDSVRLVSGPGCPVCVTDSGYIDAAIELAERPDTTVVTFGDMINVPGSRSSLAEARAGRATVEICYSPLRAVELAEADPQRNIVFLAIGFETTIAPVTSIVDIAIRKGLENFSIMTAFKLVPPVLEALVTDPELSIDAFLCPAHVSAIIGAAAYEPFAEKYQLPCVIASFEPLDILLGIQKILEQLVAGRAVVDNQYKRVVRHEGNKIARELLERYLEETDACWRGIGVIPRSGLRLRPEFQCYETRTALGIEVKNGGADENCRCGDVLKGKILPNQCPMFATVCNPLHPVGPCMVSSEGSCAAYYRYS